MTRRDMLDRIQARVDDNVYWNDRRLTAIINMQKDKMAQAMSVVSPQYYTFVSVQGQTEYEVPSTYVTNHLLFFNSSYNQEIVIHDSPRDIHLQYSPSDTEGIPTMGYIWGVSGRRQLTIYPTFNEDGLSLQWWFYGWAEDLAVDNDEPQFPLEWHPSLASAALNETRVDDKTMTVADAELLWHREITKIRALAVTKELLSVGEKTFGDVDGTFPRINDGSGKEPLPFRIVGTDGAIW